MQKFEETRSVTDRPISGRRSLSDERTDAVKEAVREIGAINEWGVSSVGRYHSLLVFLGHLCILY